MTKIIELATDERLWKLRLRMNQQMLFSGIEKFATSSGSSQLQTTMAQRWYSGLDMREERMLPDGEIVPGAPTQSSLDMRRAIIGEVLDGLKYRPRTSAAVVPQYSLDQLHYDLLLAMCQAFEVSETMIKAKRINPYEAAGLETTIWTMLHVARSDDPSDIYKAIGPEDFQNCPL